MSQRAPLVAAAALFVVAGCSDYLDRRETVVPWAGDAHQANLVTHAVDPMPHHAHRRDLRHDGERVGEAYRRYRTGRVTPPARSVSTTVLPRGMEAAGEER
jgi:hypothetical protein